MKHAWTAWIALAFTFAGARCSARSEPHGEGGRADTAPAGDGESGDAAAPFPQRGNEAPALGKASLVGLLPYAIAWTAGGELAIVDGTTGAVRDAAGAPGGAAERDVAWDPWAGRVLVFQGSDEDDSGELAEVPVIAGPLLGKRAHVAWIDGRARVLATPLGTVVFEQGYGERWELLSGVPSASLLAPVPSSAWLDVNSGGTLLHGLDYGADAPALVTRTAVVKPGGLTQPLAHALPIAPATSPPTARLVPAPARGDAILLDVSGSLLSARVVKGAAVGPASLVPLGATGLRIEGAVALAGGRAVAILTSGSSEVVALALDPSGAVASVAEVSLPGEVTESPRFFSRELVALEPGRLLAATSAGVFALSVRQNKTGIHLALSSAFDGAALRGPLAAMAP